MKNYRIWIKFLKNQLKLKSQLKCKKLKSQLKFKKLKSQFKLKNPLEIKINKVNNFMNGIYLVYYMEITILFYMKI